MLQEKKTEMGGRVRDKFKKHHQKPDTTDQAKIQIYHHKFTNGDEAIDL